MFAFMLLVLRLLQGISLSTAEPYLVVVEGKSIVRYGLDGQDRNVLVSGLTEVLDVTNDNKYLFYPEMDGEYHIIRRCNLDGTEIRDLVTDRGSSAGIGVDPESRTIYWAISDKGAIKSCDYSGNNVRTIMYGKGNPYEMLLDLSARHIYYTDYELDHVVRCDYDGKNEVIISSSTGMDDIALDTTTNQLYWTDKNSQSIHTYDLKTETQSVLVPLTSKVWNMAIYGDYLYWTDEGTSINRVNKIDGNHPTVLRRGSDTFYSITVVASEDPVLSIKRNSSGGVQFICEILTASDSSVRHLVTWESGGIWLMYMTVTGNQSVINLDDLDKNKLQSNLSCLVCTSSASDEHECAGPLKNSNTVTSSVQVTTPELTVYEGEGGAALKVKVGAPLVFFQADELLLSLTLKREKKELRTADGEVIDQFVVQAHDGIPEIRVNSSNWDDDHKFIVKATQDGRQDGTQTREFVVNVTKIVYNPKTTVQNGLRRSKKAFYKTTNLLNEGGKGKVISKDRDSVRECHSWNDPRLRTFDGMHYSNHLEGEFVLYNHTSEDYQINVMFSRCTQNGFGTCTCAVAIKIIDDVIIMDKCGRFSKNKGEWNKHKLYIYLLGNGKLSSGMSIWSLNDGRRHRVDLPHSGQVTVGVNTFGALQVSYKPAPKDYRQTVGLCGTYDSDRTNDFTLRNGTVLRDWSSTPHAFNRDWRVRSGEETFSGVEKVKRKIDSDIIYCSVLSGGQRLCAPHLDIVTSAAKNIRRRKRRASDGIDITETIKKRFKYAPQPNIPMTMAKAGRRKRSVDDENSFNPFLPFEVDENREPKGAVWPTASGITEQQAREHCEEKVRGDAGVRQCAAMMDDQFTDIINECVDDIALTDDLVWAGAAASAILESCSTFVNSLDNSAEDNGPPPPLPGGVKMADFLSNICPNNCTARGICDNGTCKCENDFTGFDCSQKMSDPPQLDSLENRGLCDLNSSRCDAAIVYGDRFQNRDTLTCHLHPYQLGDELPASLEGSRTVAAIFTRYDLVLCPVPNATQLIRISNDGENPASDFLLHLPYDSTCQRCKSATSIKDTHCILETNWCVIENECFEKGTSVPGNQCRVCDPESSKYQWITVSGGDCVKSGNTSVIAIVIVVVIILCAVVVGLIYYFYRRHHRAELNIANKTKFEGISAKKQDHELAQL